MDTQMPIDYWKMFKDLMERRAKLIGQRDEAEVELAKMKQLIVSVFGLLSEDQQKANQQAIDDIEAESAGLQDAIKLVFSTQAGMWLTVSDVRDHLNDMGFDFRQYKANPLASIGTTLKRIAGSGYVETMNSGSGMLYRREAPLNKLKMLSDLLGPVVAKSVSKLGEGARFPKRVGDVTGPTSAHDSGMRGKEISASEAAMRKAVGRKNKNPAFYDEKK
jgi:hypothetical protein